jgi:hypothetical protein
LCPKIAKTMKKMEEYEEIGFRVFFVGKMGKIRKWGGSGGAWWGRRSDSGAVGGGVVMGGGRFGF